MGGGDREEQYDPLDILGVTLTAKQTVSEKHISFQTLVHIQKSGRSSKKMPFEDGNPSFHRRGQVIKKIPHQTNETKQNKTLRMVSLGHSTKLWGYKQSQYYVACFN